MSTLEGVCVGVFVVTLCWEFGECKCFCSVIKYVGRLKSGNMFVVSLIRTMRDWKV